MRNMQGTSQQPQAAAAKQARPPQPVPPPWFQSENIASLDEAGLLKLLNDVSATTFQRAKICQRLASVGSKQAVPALAALLSNPELAHYGRYGLEPIPDPSVDDALRGALPKLKGKLLVGVINSIGQRKDSKAVPALGKLLYGADAEVALAAAAALGSISGAAAAKALQDGLAKTKGTVRTAVAGGCLVCAEGLIAQGERQQGLALYNVLTAADIPKTVRLGAMHGIIAAETSLSRPRETPAAPKTSATKPSTAAVK